MSASPPRAPRALRIELIHASALFFPLLFWLNGKKSSRSRFAEYYLGDWRNGWGCSGSGGTSCGLCNSNARYGYNYRFWSIGSHQVIA